MGRGEWLLKDGLDPADERKKAAMAVPAPGAMTFGKCAESYISIKSPSWRNPKHRQQWTNTLATHAAGLTDKSVEEIALEDVLSVLNRIWASTPETAKRVQQRIEAILDWAIVKEYRKNSTNPAKWKGHLGRLLPTPKREVRHHPCIPYQEMPKFLVELRSRASISARALELTILCASRAKEVVEAKWEEFDLEQKTWTVPALRMKANKEHRVALCPRAVKILEELARFSDYVFPGNKRPHLNPESLRKFLQIDLKRPEATTHGFRSTFRDWAAEETNHDGEVVEMAIAHTIKSRVERAYRRQDLLEKRRTLMLDWQTFLETECGSTAPKAGESNDN